MPREPVPRFSREERGFCVLGGETMKKMPFPKDAFLALLLLPVLAAAATPATVFMSDFT